MEMSYYKYWGKARKGEDETYEYHLLPYHCLDVAAVGSVLLKSNPQILPSLHIIADYLKVDPDAFLKLLLSLHDFGKFAKTFQSLIPDIQLELQGRNRGKPVPVRHDALGAALWRNKYQNDISDRLMSEIRYECISILEALESIVNITSGHHGIPANPESSTNIDNFFDTADYQSIEEFWEDLVALFDIDIFGADNSKLQLLGQCSELIKLSSWEFAGFITFADWIGSNDTYFEPVSTPVSIENYWKTALGNAEKAVHDSGLSKSSVRKVYSFNELLPRISQTPTPLQHYCDTCEISEIPQLWVLEDVTGAGKTEAALILTARLMAIGLGNGLFVALPTMATSDAMYKRLSEQYIRLFEAKSFPSIVLAHGARHLSKEFKKSFLDISVHENAAIDEKDASAAQCNRWFSDSNKKALLADAGVGTIDQVLISVLPARHQSLRLFGLQGKILIIDEVHAYDSYQHRLLCGLLEHHALNGGSAILLSATLPKNVRQSLANAYLKGGGKCRTGTLQKDNYPLATCISCDGVVYESELDTRADLKRTIDVQFESVYNKIPEMLINEAKNGKCCGWIRNTVSDAITAYEEIIAAYPKEMVSLLHSRFTYADRMVKESELIRHFGPESNAGLRTGRIVIATQVIEQSLDVDFDVLVSDLAPIDYLIQRLGRLFRHKRDAHGNRNHQEMRGVPSIIIYGPEPVNNPLSTWYSEVLSGASFVYKDHAVLWKTQQALEKAGKKITTPGDANTPDGIRNLMKKVYGDDAFNTPEKLQNHEDKAIGDSGARDGMGRFNLLSFQEGYSPKSSGQWCEEVQVPTRIGESQMSVYLTKVVGNELRPFEEGEYSWDLSVVKVRAGLVSNIVFDEQDQRMITELKEKTKRLYEKDFVVPLRFEGGIWSCVVEDEKRGPCSLVYDDERGFCVVIC